MLCVHFRLALRRRAIWEVLWFDHPWVWTSSYLTRNSEWTTNIASHHWKAPKSSTCPTAVRKQVLPFWLARSRTALLAVWSTAWWAICSQSIRLSSEICCSEAVPGSWGLAKVSSSSRSAHACSLAFFWFCRRSLEVCWPFVLNNASLQVIDLRSAVYSNQELVFWLWYSDARWSLMGQSLALISDTGWN